MINLDRGQSLEKRRRGGDVPAVGMVAPFLLMILFSLLTLGCNNQLTMQQLPLFECPDTVIPCRPNTYAKVTLDTSSDGYGYYLAISRVDGLNREVDEFGVAFHQGGKEGWATIREKKGGKSEYAIYNVGFSKITSASPASGLDVDGNLMQEGSPAWSAADGDRLALAGRLPERVFGDYDLAEGNMSGTNRLSEIAISPLSATLYWDAQPAFSPDGSALYVATTRPGGFGGTDIYVSRRKSNGEWSELQNLGPAVNTPCDDLSPFVSGDGKWLYFSSSGHETVGGYDLFRAPLVAGRPGKVENLGKPINTTDDELFPSAPLNADPDTLLYYSSNQKGSKGFDVYVLNRRFHGRPGQSAGTERPDTVELTGTIRYSDGKPVDGATVTIDQRNPPKRIDSMSSGKDGKYGFDIVEGKKYDVTASKEGNLYGSETIEVPVYNNREQIERDIIFLDTVVFRVNFPFNDAGNPYEFTLDDRGLPTDRRWIDVIAQAAEVLRRIPASSGTRIELVGHTDPIGSDAYNIDLGRRRAEFIKRELVARGVSPSMLTVRSAGEGQPLRMHPGEADELYRARLRRVELFRKE